MPGLRLKEAKEEATPLSITRVCWSIAILLLMPHGRSATGSSSIPSSEKHSREKRLLATVYAPFEGKNRLVGFTPVPSIGWAASAGTNGGGSNRAHSQSPLPTMLFFFCSFHLPHFLSHWPFPGKLRVHSEHFVPMRLPSGAGRNRRKSGSMMCRNCWIWQTPSIPWPTRCRHVKRISSKRAALGNHPDEHRGCGHRYRYRRQDHVHECRGGTIDRLDPPARPRRSR